MTLLLTTSPLLLLGLPHGMEWIIIGIAILLFFGGKKIPELIRGVGKGVNEFNKAKKGANEDDDQQDESNRN